MAVKKSAPFCFLVFINALKFYSAGVPVLNWMFYGFSMWRPIPEIVNPGPIGSVIEDNTNLLRGLFNTVSTPIFESVAMFLAFSFFIRLVQLCILYLIFKHFLKRTEIALLSVTFISFGYRIYGLVQNGICEAPIWYLASFSSVFSLLGILVLIKRKPLAAGILMAIGCHFHIVYGMTAAVPVIFAFGYYALTQRKVQTDILKSFLALCTVFILGLLPLIPSTTTSELTMTTLSIEEWYRFIITRDPDDVALVFTLANFGLPVSGCLGFVMLATNSNKSNIGPKMLLGILIFFAFCAIVELLHQQGIFFGILSEYFIAAQFRRGFWIIALFLCPLLAQVIGDQGDVNTPIFWIICFLVLATLTDNNILTATTLAVAVIFLNFKQRPKNLFVIAPLLLGSFYYTFSSPFFTESFDKYKALVETLAPAVIMGLITSFIVWVFKGNTRLALVLLALLFPIWRFFPANIMISAQSAKVLEHLDQKMSYDDLVNLVIWRRGERFFRFQSEQEVRLWVDALLSLEKLKPESGRLLIDPTKLIDPRLYVPLPLYLFEFQDRALSIFSRDFASNYNYRLETLFDLHIPDLYESRSHYSENIKKSFLELTPERLLKTKNVTKIQYIITRTQYPTLKRLYSNPIYHVYELVKVS